MAKPPSAALKSTLVLGLLIFSWGSCCSIIASCWSDWWDRLQKKLEQVRCDPAVIPHCLPGAGVFWWVFLLFSQWHVCHRCPAGTQKSHALQSAGTDMEMLLVLGETVMVWCVPG